MLEGGSALNRIGRFPVKVRHLYFQREWNSRQTIGAPPEAMREDVYSLIQADPFFIESLKKPYGKRQ
jgi:hypothetical protein